MLKAANVEKEIFHVLWRRIEQPVEAKNVDARLAEETELRRFGGLSDRVPSTRSTGIPRSAATRADWNCAASGLSVRIKAARRRG